MTDEMNDDIVLSTKTLSLICASCRAQETRRSKRLKTVVIFTCGHERHERDGDYVQTKPCGRKVLTK